MGAAAAAGCAAQAAPEAQFRVKVDTAGAANPGDVVQRTMMIIARRMSALHIGSEGRQDGSDVLMISLTRKSDLATARDLATRPGRLSFQLVDEEQSAEPFDPAKPPPMRDAVKSRTPGEGWLLVKRVGAIDGAHLKRASAGADENGHPAIHLNFDGEGSRALSAMTGAHRGERFAIIIDGEAISAPVIQGPIPNGEAQITGAFTEAETRNMAAVLSGGALPAPVTLTP